MQVGAGLAFFRKEKVSFDTVHQKAWAFALQQHLRVLLGQNHQRGARKLLLTRRAVYFQLAKVPCIYSAVQPEAPVSFPHLLQAQHPQLCAAIREGRSANRTQFGGCARSIHRSLHSSVAGCKPSVLKRGPEGLLHALTPPALRLVLLQRASWSNERCKSRVRHIPPDLGITLFPSVAKAGVLTSR